MKKYTFFIILTLGLTVSFFTKAQDINTFNKIFQDRKIQNVYEKSTLEKKPQSQKLQVLFANKTLGTNVDSKNNSSVKENGLILESKNIINKKYEEAVKEKEHPKTNQSIPTTHLQTPVNKD